MATGSDTADIAVVGRDGRVLLLDGRTGRERRTFVISDEPPIAIHGLASRYLNGRAYLGIALKPGAPDDIRTRDAESIAVGVDLTDGAITFRKNLGSGRQIFFPELHFQGTPIMLVWDAKTWQVLHAVTGDNLSAGALAAPMIGWPAISDFEGRHDRELVFQFSETPQPIMVLNPLNGVVRWVASPELRLAERNQPRGPGNSILRTPKGEYLVVRASSDGGEALAAIHPLDGNSVWQVAGRPSGAFMVNSGSANDCRIFVTMVNEGMLCLDGLGRTLWKLRFKADVAANNWDDRSIVLIDGQTGEVIWRHKTQGPNMGGVAAYDLNGDGLCDIVAVSCDGFAYALRGNNGALLWQTPISGGGWSIPTVDDLNNDGSPHVMITSLTGRLHVIDGRTGTLCWSPSVKGDWKIAGKSKVIREGSKTIILAPLGNAGVVAFDWSARTEIWRSSREFPVIASPVVADLAHDGRRQVLIGATTGDVLALDLAVGRPLWRLKLGNEMIEGDPVLFDLTSQGVMDVIVADHQAHLHVINGNSIAEALW